MIYLYQQFIPTMIANQRSLNNQQSVSKKYNLPQTTHLLLLPREITDTINSYLFYDKMSGETRIKMRQILDRFKYARLKRDDDLDQHWGVSMNDSRVQTRNEVQFQAINCKLCSGYIFVTNEIIPIRAKCHCNIH